MLAFIHLHSVVRLINIALRCLTLLSKFLLIFFLARYLEPVDLGLYGLVIATVSYAIYPLGFDFYTYSTREILKREQSDWGHLLKSQGVLHLLLYLIFLPILSLAFVFDLLPWYLAPTFFVILVLEHINQELNRLLIAISKQLMASWVLFLRSGLWSLVVVVWMFYDPAARTLQFVMAAWITGGFLAVLLAGVVLYRLRLSGWRKDVDWPWLCHGLKVAIPLLVSTLALQGVLTFDRYWFEALQGLEVLAAYVLFMSMGNALLTFLDAGVFSFSYPKLIVNHSKRDSNGFRKNLIVSLLLCVLFIIVFISAACLLIVPLLNILDKPVYLLNISIFYYVLLIVALYAVSMVPHYALYAQGYDKPIIYSHLAAFVLFLVVTWLLSGLIPNMAVLLGLIAAFSTLLIWKSWAFYRLTPKSYRSAVDARAH